MDLFYTPSHLIDLDGGTLAVGGEEFFHITRVLRKKEGEVIRVTDGEGLSVKAALSLIGKKGLTAEIVEKEHVSPLSTKVTIAMSLLKSSQRFDFFLEKATELGVARIIPMITERTVSLPGREKVIRKQERWKKVLVSALCQTKRYHLPQITEPLGFDSVLRLEGYDIRMIPYETSASSPNASFSGKNVLFIVGGEGGFTETEVSRARESGISEISFGRSILRAETAGIFAIAMVRSQVVMHEQPDNWM